MRDADRYLLKRGKRWHYVRRVPEHVGQLDARDVVRASLKTLSLDVARIRRDNMEEADDLYWAALISGGGVSGPGAVKRYDAARARAVALGFTYRTAQSLGDDAPLGELVRRVEALEGGGQIVARDVEAVLGGAPVPKVPVTQALDDYFKHIAPVELKGKSDKQRRSFEKVKRRAIANFIKVVSDKPVDEISREDALKYYDWWRDRVTGTNGARALSGNSANRDIGNMRLLVREHFKRIGEEDRPNPFRNLNFADKKVDRKDVPPFPVEWIISRILKPESFIGLNHEAAFIVLAMIETGCRPSEICNLVTSNIRLLDDVPHLHIVFREDRAIKTESSVRDIPLVGISLAAMQQWPNGFERYRDKEDALSAVLMKHFRRSVLFPTPAHRIYSFRHSFEKRMLEAGIDYGLRCLLMGHANDRPDYGDGGSLAFRRDQLQRIALPVSGDLVSTILAARRNGRAGRG